MNEDKKGTDEEKEWPAEYKFSYFHTLHRCVQGFIGSISKKENINLPQGKSIYAKPKDVESKDVESKKEGSFELIPSSFNRKTNTIHYFSLKAAWINNRKRAADDLERNSELEWEKLADSWGFKCAEDFVGYLIGEQNNIDDVIGKVIKHSSVDDNKGKVDLRKLIRELLMLLVNKEVINLFSPSIDWKDKRKIRERFALADEDGWEPKNIKVEDWFSLYYNLFTPCSWMEEGIVYQLLKDMTLKGMTKDTPVRKLPVFFDMEAGEKIEEGLEYNGKSIKNYSRKISYWDNEWKELNNKKNEKDIVREYTGIAMKLKDISSILLRFFSGSEGLEFYSGRRCLIFPIYTVYIDNQGYGGIWGFYYLGYDEKNEKNEKDEKDIVELITPVLVDASYKLFESMFLRVHAHLDDQLPGFGGHIELDELFFRSIISAQDWENIWLIKKPYSECKTKEDIISHWGRKNNDGFLKNNWENLTNEFNDKEFSELQQKLRDNPEKFFKWALNDIRDMFFTNLEKAEFSDLLNGHIICEYPEVVSLPKEGSREMGIFEDRLQEQQLRIFEIIINKWRRYRDATQLAASAIMSRNMSHNIGSHVLAKVIPHLSTVAEETVAKELQEALKKSRKLFYYLQMRMDHLAEVATMQRYASRSISLSFNQLVKDVNDVNEGQEFIRRYISGVDVGKNPLEFLLKLKNKKEVYTAIPNGNTGAHAFYIILENYIRNVAKHNIPKDKDTFSVHINIEDNVAEYPDMIEISLWENLEKQLQLKKKETVYEYLEDKKDNINNYIDKPIIGTHFMPREKSWGIAEMVLSAQYLRQDQYEKLPTLKAFVVNSEGEEIVKDVGNDDTLCLGLKFYMQKPKEVLIISDKEPSNKVQEKLGLLLGYGINWITPCKNLTSILEENNGYRRLVLLGDIAIKKSYDLSMRIFKNTADSDECATKTYALVEEDNVKERIEEIVKENTESDLVYGFFTDLDEIWCNFLRDRHGWSEKQFLLLGEDNREAKEFLIRNWMDIEFDKEKDVLNFSPLDGQKPVEEFEGNQSFLVLYKRHPIKGSTLSEEPSELSKFKELKSHFKFVEVYEAASSLGSTWEKEKWDEPFGKFYKYEFLSAALTKIVIIDERIQALVHKADPEEHKTDPKEMNQITSEEVIKNSRNRVFVPPKEIDLNSKPCWEDIKGYIEEKGENDPIDCIVIHWTILEKLEKNDNLDIKEIIDRLAGISEKESLYPDSRPPPLSVAVCTGRGKMRIDAGNETIQTIPISELSKWVVSSGPSKYHLCKLLGL